MAETLYHGPKKTPGACLQKFSFGGGVSRVKNKKGAPARAGAPWDFNPGGDLRSHAVASAVSSAQRGLTTVFGMGTGVTPAVWPPGKCKRPTGFERWGTKPNKADKPQIPLISRG